MKNLAVIATALAFSLVGCSHNDNVQQLDATEFNKMIANGQVQLVDVRTSEEYAAGHIGYAINIDVQQPDFTQMATARLDKASPVYIYCRSGRRSATAAKLLVAQGYTIVNLQGGIEAWQHHKLPLTH